MIDPYVYPAIFSKVHNRGIPPLGFIQILVETMRDLPDDMFGPGYGGAEEPGIYSWLHQGGRKWDIVQGFTKPDLTRRRAIMCEVLRVLGGFESSWDWNEGRDVTNPSSNKPETTEAGIFQCSANSVNFDASLIESFNRHATDRGVDLDPWIGMRESGYDFQWMTKNIPAYAIEHCARLLRFTIRHHGPILRGEILPWLSLDAVREFESLLSNTPMSTTPTPPATSTTNRKISYVIDPGHGGSDSGAVGTVDGVSYAEKKIVLDVSIKLFSLMEADDRFTTLGRTRSRDEFIPLADRAKFANTLGAKLVSIHANAGGGTGFECFTTPGQTESDKLATSLLSHYAGEFAGWTTRYDMKDGDPDKEARFTVLTGTEKASVLFELGFMDRPEDLRRMVSSDFVERAARALYLGILQHEGLTLPGAPASDGVTGPTGGAEDHPVTIPIEESGEAAAFARGREEGVAAAIKKLDDLARENVRFHEYKPDDERFGLGQRNYLTGYFGASFLRKSTF
jgi:N-acetylmuramoyl-L-alanine amidase